MPSSIKKTYCSRNGRHLFVFEFKNQGRYINIVCTRYPSLRGRAPSVVKTHIYPSGNLCFVSGREPRTLRRAEKLAAQWAEYILGYIRTGKAQV